MAFKVLSIDGGGMRGIIPLMILRQLELKTGKSTADLFDLIAGTSTGGLIACALTLRDEADPTRSMYSAAQVLELYQRNATRIFPRSWMHRTFPFTKGWWSNLRHPLYRATGFEAVLRELLTEKTLRDCRRPLLISAYDITRHQPVYFTHRFYNPTSGGYKGRGYQYDAQQDLRLTDICRATSAAPTYFPAHSFDIQDFIEPKTDTNSVTCIDGGIFINNPSLAALAELHLHRNDSLYTQGGSRPIDPLNNVHILSLGTGFDGTTQALKATSWGTWRWKNHIYQIMMKGGSQAIEQQVSDFLGDRHVRVAVELKKYTELDDTSSAALTYWTEETNRQVINNFDQWESINKLIAI